MAVIRAARLFEQRYGPSLGGERQILPDQFDYTAYTVPAGHKAIIRQITAVLIGSPPSSTKPYYHLKLKPSSGSEATVWHFAWFFDPNTSPLIYRYDDDWSGQLVLNPGDQVTVYNGSTTGLHLTASGHLLPENPA